MKQVKWILAVLMVFSLCIIGGTVLADEPAPELALRVVNGTKTQVTPYDQYSGSYYYKVYIDNIPEGARAVQMGFGAVTDSEPDTQWFESLSELCEDQGGLFMISLPPSSTATSSDAIFVRMNEEQEWQKAAFVYDRTKTNGSAVTVTNESAPALNEDYTITWEGTNNADAFIVNWKMPNGRTSRFSVSGKTRSLQLYSLADRFGDMSELTRYAGNYEVWIETYAGDQIGTSQHAEWTVSVPENNDPEIHLSSSEADEHGVITVPVYGEVQLFVTAEDSVLNNYIKEFHFVNGLWTEGVNPMEIWQNGYARMSWRPNREIARDYTVYAYAIIQGEDGQPDRLVRSNTLTVRVTMNNQIADSVTYIVDGETAGNSATEPIGVPKDGTLVLHVDNIGADYYGAEIDEQGIHLDHIAESRWVTPEPGDTTEVRLPVFECEVGKEYEVKVYALKLGAPMRYSEQTVRVRVTDRTTSAPVILEIAGDRDNEGVFQYETDERIRIYAYYENPGEELDEEYSWIQVRAYNRNRDYCFWDESGNGFYYWTDGMRIGNPDDYVIEAVIMTNGGDWNREAWEVEGTQVSAEIHVEAPHDQLDAPNVTLSPFKSRIGENGNHVTLTVGAVDHAERYFYWIHPSDDHNDRMSGDLCAAGTVEIDTGLLGPGVYAVEVSAHARGYQENFTTSYFVVMGGDDTDLSRNEYCFSTNTRQADQGAETDFIADTGENIRFTGYLPGSGEINLGVFKAGWSEPHGFGWCEAPGLCQWHCFDEAGIYTVYMGGVVNGVWREYPVCTIAVSADGDLDNPEVMINGSAFTDGVSIAPDAENPQKLTVVFDKVDHADHYYLEIREDGDGWAFCQEDIDPEDIEDDTIVLNVENDMIRPGRVYRVYLTANAYGYNWGRTEGIFLLAAGEQTAGITLTVNGSNAADQTALSSTNMHVKVTWPEGQGTLGRPTAVRVLNNNQWEYWFGDDSYERDWGYGDGRLFFYAEATWNDEYDFEELGRNGWGDFDWDQDVEWTGKSNIIRMNVTSPNGTMIAPAFHLEKDELEWGEDLVIMIEDAGPSMIDTDAPEGRSIVDDGWFYINIEVDRGDHWDWYNDFHMDLRQGENRIPTYWITPGSRCRVEVGADGQGYSGRSNRVQFTVGEKPQSQEAVKVFTVNGTAGTMEEPGTLTAATHSNLHIQAYHQNAEWYNVEITEAGNEDWRENCDNCRIGMLMDSWRSDHAGEFTLTAYAYGHHRDAQGNIIWIDGTNEWEEPIGQVLVTYEADGDLGVLTATMPDRAYVGDPITITFGAVDDAEEYSYWIHEDTDRRWLMGDSRHNAGDVTFDTGNLEPDVYWVELDAMATGYNQSHATLHLALLDPDDTDLTPPSNEYYFTTSMQWPTPKAGENEPETDFVVEAGRDFRFTFYVPGAEEVNLSQQKSDWENANGFAGCDGPGVSQWHSFDSRGEYTVYGSYQADGQWCEPIALCTVTVTAEGSLDSPWVDMPMVVSAGEDVHITYHIDSNIENYSYWVSYEDEGWNITNEWINRDQLPAGIDTFDLVIPADRLEPNRIYHVYLDTNTPGWEQGHGDRTLYVLGAPEEDAVALTVNEQNGQPAQMIAIGNRYPVSVSAPDADGLMVWWDESLSFINVDGGYFEGEFCLDWKGGEYAPDYCEFYAIAIYGGSHLKVSETTHIPISNRGDAPEATAPTLSMGNEGTIYRGQFIEAIVGAIDDEGVYEYDAYITDEWGNWICHNSRSDAGTVLLPTNDLEPGQTYRLRAYARVLGKYRTDSAPISLTVSEPTEGLFVADKSTVAVMEPLMVSIMAPGAERIRFSSGYDRWDDENGWEGDSWYSDWISWDRHSDIVTMYAQAWYPNATEWMPVGDPDGIEITITAEGDLNQPEFIGFPASIVQGENLSFAVGEVAGAEEYEVEINRNDGRDGWNYRTNNPNFFIAGHRLYEGGYRIRVIAMAHGWNAGENETSLYVEPIRPEIGIGSVVSNAEPLDITVPLIEGGDRYELMIHYVPFEDFEQSKVYVETMYARDADQNGILTFTVPAGRLLDNMSHWVDLYVSGDDFYAENAKAFLVQNGKKDSNITVAVNGETGSEFADVLIHDDFTVDVSAPGAGAIIIHCGDMWQAFAGNQVTGATFSEHQDYPETLYAQAYYGSRTDFPDNPWDDRWLDFEWSLPSETVVVNFYAIGQVGEPWGRFPNIVTQGDILVISDIYPGDNGNETHANINRNAPNEYEDRVFGDNWYGWNPDSRTIYLPTNELEANRDYWIMLDNSGIGMTGNRMWWRVSVFPRSEQQADVMISALEKVQAGMEIPVSVSAPGAMEVGFGLNLEAADKDDVEDYQFRGEPGEDTFFTRGGWFRIDEPGVYTLTAYALFQGSEVPLHVDRTIEICEPLRFDMTDMPGYFTAGQENASVTVELPDNAQRMTIQARVEGENLWRQFYNSNEDELTDKAIQIPAMYLNEGNRIVIDFQAKADGFEDVGESVFIPVTAATQSNAVTLRLVNNREERTELDLNDIWANQDTVYLATPAAGQEIAAIRFYSGYGWWEGGDAITRDNHGDWFLNDGSVFFEEWYNDANNRIITAFAEVLVEGSDVWQRTNAIRFTVKNNGIVGEYNFTDTGDITVPRGTVVTVEFEPAENAARYWVDAFDVDDHRSWNPWSWYDGTTVHFNTNRLPAGVYELYGRAGGPDGSGLIWRESTEYVLLTITDNSPQMDNPTFTTPGSLTVIEDEAFSGIAAKVIMITGNVESIGDNAFSGSSVEQVGFQNRDTEVSWNAFSECSSDLVVFGIPGGSVEQWAEGHNYTFYPLVMQN